MITDSKTNKAATKSELEARLTEASALILTLKSNVEDLASQLANLRPNIITMFRDGSDFDEMMALLVINQLATPIDIKQWDGRLIPTKGIDLDVANSKVGGKCINLHMLDRWMRKLQARGYGMMTDNLFWFFPTQGPTNG